MPLVRRRLEIYASLLDTSTAAPNERHVLDKLAYKLAATYRAHRYFQVGFFSDIFGHSPFVHGWVNLLFSRYSTISLIKQLVGSDGRSQASGATVLACQRHSYTHFVIIEFDSNRWH
jgi:hypothetical protein